MVISGTIKPSLDKFFYTAVRQNPNGWGKDLTDEQIKTIQKEIEHFYFNDGSMENVKLSAICDVNVPILYYHAQIIFNCFSV